MIYGKPAEVVADVGGKGIVLCHALIKEPPYRRGLSVKCFNLPADLQQPVVTATFQTLAVQVEHLDHILSPSSANGIKSGSRQEFPGQQ
jgi:hypothetical protein